MSANDLVANKMERIKHIFQSSKELASKEKNVPALILELNKTENEFLSLAFEGASMEIALQSIAQTNSLNSWNDFLNASSIHAPQIHVGLGWAVAQEKLNDSYLSEIKPEMRFRIWDGCGYFDGIFRQRQTIKNQTRLDYIPEKDFNNYDQGLGRSLWYICKGDESKLTDLLKNFPPTCFPNLWRGIGIAIAYVGGCDEERLTTIADIAGEHKKQLGSGSKLVYDSRLAAGTLTGDAELTYKLFSEF